MYVDCLSHIECIYFHVYTALATLGKFRIISGYIIFQRLVTLIGAEETGT